MLRLLEWCIVVLAALVAGWFAFDGTFALLTGDYVTPATGPYAGQLGPWATMMAATGVDPRATFIKVLFLAYGTGWLVVIAAFVARRRWAWAAMVAAAVCSLWYLPFGTLLGLIQISLLFLPAIRERHDPRS